MHTSTPLICEHEESLCIYEILRSRGSDVRHMYWLLDRMFQHFANDQMVAAIAVSNMGPQAFISHLDRMQTRRGINCYRWFIDDLSKDVWHFLSEDYHYPIYQRLAEQMKDAFPHWLENSAQEYTRSVFNILQPVFKNEAIREMGISTVAQIAICRLSESRTSDRSYTMQSFILSSIDFIVSIYKIMMSETTNEELDEAV